MPADNCNDALTSPIFDIIRYDRSKSLHEYFNEFLRTATEDDVKAAVESGLDMTLPIEGVPIPMKGIFNAEYYDTWHEAQESGQFRDLTEDEVISRFQLINHAADRLKAWSECMGRKSGLKANFEI